MPGELPTRQLQRTGLGRNHQGSLRWIIRSVLGSKKRNSKIGDKHSGFEEQFRACCLWIEAKAMRMSVESLFGHDTAAFQAGYVGPICGRGFHR